MVDKNKENKLSMNRGNSTGMDNPPPCTSMTGAGPKINDWYCQSLLSKWYEHVSDFLRGDFGPRGMQATRLSVRTSIYCAVSKQMRVDMRCAPY